MNYIDKRSEITAKKLDDGDIELYLRNKISLYEVTLKLDPEVAHELIEALVVGLGYYRYELCY